MTVNKAILNQKLEDVVFNIFDTETTGDNSKNQDRPIEIAVVPFNLKNGFLDKPWERLIDPQMPIHPSAIPVHGLTDEDVQGKPLLQDVMPELLEYVEGSSLVAHNIKFDLAMLPEFEALDNPKIDTLRLAKHIFQIGELGYKDQDLRSYKCQELRYWLNIKVDTMGLPAHRAAADILVTGEVFRQTLIRFIERTYSETLQDLYDFVNAPIMIDIMPFGKYKNVSLQEAVRKEIKNPKNYFAWLLKSVHAGEMSIDEDLKYSIEYHLKAHDIDLVALLVDEQHKDWKTIATQTKSTKSKKM